MTEDIRAYAVKQDVVDYSVENLVMLQAQLINRDYVGKVMVEKVSKDAGGYAAGKYYIPGVALNFGEHPVEAGHRILTEELEVEDREIKYVSTQSHWNDEKKHWYVLFIFETVDPFTEEEMKNVSKGDLIGMYYEPKTGNLILKEVDTEDILKATNMVNDKVDETYDN